MQFVVAHDHPSLPGHFPGRPVVPGVVLLDRVFAALEAAHGPLAAARLPQVKFLQPLLPGEPARVELVPADAHAADAAASDAQAAAPRWRFRVLREDGVLLASGEVLAQARA